MIDAHCHLSAEDSSIGELLIGRDFVGIHPWEAQSATAEDIDRIRRILSADSRVGVGEIGLDRMREREISPQMQNVFEAQLSLALEFDRPVVLHGAKCWGRVVQSVKKISGRGSRLSFMFHGFSRSGGLIPEIVSLGGFISVGPAVLNDHAVNYRKLVAEIPLERLLVETDRTEEPARISISEVIDALALLRGESADLISRATDENAGRFFGFDAFNNQKGCMV